MKTTSRPKAYLLMFGLVLFCQFLAVAIMLGAQAVGIERGSAASWWFGMALLYAGWWYINRLQPAGVSLFNNKLAAIAAGVGYAATLAFVGWIFLTYPWQ